MHQMINLTFINRIFSLTTIFCFLLIIYGCSNKKEEILITDNWVRSTPPGETVGAAYLTMKSNRDLTLVSIDSPAADSIEIHSMIMENGIMKMRQMDNLNLKAGESVKLEPNGFHLMLFDLKHPLVSGQNVTFNLHFKDPQGKIINESISSPISDSKE